jgi:signal transduction histidine kinase
MNNLLICPDATANFIGLFDLSIAPTLLYYSYIPIAVLSLFFGFFVFSRDVKSLLGRIFLILSFLFSLFLVNEIVQWTAVHANIVYFSWSIAPVFQILIWVLAIYFVSVFVNKRDLSFAEKLTLSIVILPVLLLIPSDLNVQFFDINNCEAVSGYMWNYLYIFETLSILCIIAISLKKYFDRKLDLQIRRQILILTLGMILFLSLFAASNIFGEITKIYEVNLIGPVGMIIFLGLLTFLIVRFKTFNIKLVGSQALVFAIIFLVGSEFFFVTTLVNRILVGVTLLLVCIGGYYLVKSVKNEIKAKESLQIANARLRELDKQKSEFISFATHQLRSPLTAIKGNTSLILEGDLGQISAPLKDVVDTIYTSVKTMINVVEDYLNISRIELGTMKYTLVEMDFKDLLKEVVNEQKPNIDAKGLAYSLSLDESQTYKIKADSDKFKQVIMNTIDNSIKYTKIGSIVFSLNKDLKKNTVQLKISDTGVGIEPGVIPKLFQKFTRAANANEANIHGTGLGLYIAKEIMNAHGGRIWAESAGEGKGSQFYVEIPLAK